MLLGTVLGLGDTRGNRMGTTPALMVHVVFRYSTPKEGKLRKMEERLSRESGLFSFVYLFNSPSM